MAQAPFAASDRAGGSASFNYASRQPKLNGAVVYYGTAPKEKDQLASLLRTIIRTVEDDLPPASE